MGDAVFMAVPCSCIGKLLQGWIAMDCAGRLVYGLLQCGFTSPRRLDMLRGGMDVLTSGNSQCRSSFM